MSAWNELKLNKKHKYVIYKLSNDLKEIVVEEASDNDDWDAFRSKLQEAKTVREPALFFSWSLSRSLRFY